MKMYAATSTHYGLNMSQQCALAAKKASNILSCAIRNTGSRVSELMIPLYLRLLRPHLDVTSSLGPLNTRGLPSCLELEQLACKERLKG